MTITLNDKETLKTVLLELLQEDKAFCQAVAKEIGMEKSTPDVQEAEREEELTKMMNKHFDEFDDVFKALA